MSSTASRTSYRAGGVEITPAREAALLETVAVTLYRAGFSKRALLPLVVVVVRTGFEPYATSRGDLAGHFRANGLDAFAREITVRKVPPGHVLAYLELESAPDEVALSSIVSFRLARALAVRRGR